MEKRAVLEQQAVLVFQSVRRKASNCYHTFPVCACLRIVGFVLRTLALVLHFNSCSLLSTTDHVGGPMRRFWGKRSKQDKMYVYHTWVILGDDHWFCTTFGLREEIYCR